MPNQEADAEAVHMAQLGGALARPAGLQLGHVNHQQLPSGQFPDQLFHSLLVITPTLFRLRIPDQSIPVLIFEAQHPTVEAPLILPRACAHSLFPRVLSVPVSLFHFDMPKIISEHREMLDLNGWGVE